VLFLPALRIVFESRMPAGCLHSIVGLVNFCGKIPGVEVRVLEEIVRSRSAVDPEAVPGSLSLELGPDPFYGIDRVFLSPPHKPLREVIMALFQNMDRLFLLLA
jgi:hypothetical protein